MTEVLCQSLWVNYKNSFKLIRNTISQFTSDQWLRSGYDNFQMPVKISYHMLDALDYYFRTKPDGEYIWGHHFGGGWWELNESDLPDPQELLEYLDDIEVRVRQAFFKDLVDEDLAEPFDHEREHGDTRLEHYIYALRHTMHHHGALSLLSLQFENPKGIWV